MDDLRDRAREAGKQLGQRFDSLGTPTGSEFHTYTTYSQFSADVSHGTRGVNAPVPTVVDVSKFFEQEPHVTVQLKGMCWTSELTTAKTNTAEHFKASAP